MFEKSAFCKKVEDVFNVDLISNPEVRFDISMFQPGENCVTCRLTFYTENWKTAQKLEDMEKRLGVNIQRSFCVTERNDRMLGGYGAYVVIIDRNKELAKEMVRLATEQVCCGESSKHYYWSSL